MHYMRQKEYAKLFKELILEDLEYEEEIELDDQARMAIQQLDEYFDREYFYQNRKKNNKKLFAWISIAAAASIICAISVLWYTRGGEESGGIGIADNRSTLITSNGKEIKLDGTSNVELLR
ncbi:MAG: hypothetical protein ACN6PN_22720, partial [Sphingobacterium sp.]